MRITQSLVAMLLCSAVLMLPGNASAQATGSQEPTFATDVAPILYRSCVKCHRTGQIAPMSLISYQARISDSVVVPYR